MQKGMECQGEIVTDLFHLTKLVSRQEKLYYG